MDNKALDALEARLRDEAGAMYGDEPEMSLYSEAADAIRELRAELAAEKAAHWRTCQTAAHEAEERDKAELERDSLRATCESMRRVLVAAKGRIYQGVPDGWIDHGIDCELGTGENGHCTCGLSAWIKSLDAAIDAALAARGSLASYREANAKLDATWRKFEKTGYEVMAERDSLRASLAAVQAERDRCLEHAKGLHKDVGMSSCPACPSPAGTALAAQETK